MGFDDLSDEDKQKLLSTMKSGQEEAPASKMGSFGFNQAPSYASTNVAPDVSGQLNQNEANNDVQNAAKQAALEKFANQGLTPMNQKIAEGMGGVGSLENVALSEARPALQGAMKAAAPYAEEAAGGLQKVFPKLQKYFQAGEVKFPAANTAEAMQVHKALEQNGVIGANRSLTGPFYK